MRDKLGVLIVEEEDGSVGVQLFTDPVKGKESFDNWVGKAGQKPQRARYISLTDKSGQADVVVKDLPVEVEKKDHYKIGDNS